MTDFFSSDAGQCASTAKQFLEAALVLDAAQRENGRILFRPTLAVAGHGLELMLKACFHLNGRKPPTSGKRGHDILKLWVDDVCEPVRGSVFANAMLVVERNRTDGFYPDIPDGDRIIPTIDEYVTELCRLHGRARYPLRYPADAGQKAPKTPFLIKSLWGAADDLVKRPSEFKLSRFRGER